MGIYWKNIDPEMQILGPTQQFIFNQNLNQFQFDNTFVPTSLVPSQNLFELRNSGLSGFRFRHETTFGDTHGTLKIQSFVNGQTTGTDLMTFNQDGTITIDAGLIFDDLNFTKLGIGIDPSTDGRIEFANTSLDTKIRFFTNNTPGNTFDQSGFGYLTGGGTIYHCPIGKSHLFFTGANGNNPVEINDLGMRVSGTGISSTDFRKIIFWGIANNPHQTNAIGVQLDGLPSNYTLFRQQVASINNSFTWNYGTSDTTSNELMRLHPTNGLIVKNQIVPTEGNPTHTYFKIENLSGGGHRFVHSITAGAISIGVGSLTLQVMNNEQSTIDILNFGFSTLSLPGFGGDTYAIFGGFNAQAANATLGVNEGKWNVLNEASCFRVVSLTNSAKIEIQNTSISGRLYELRSDADGTFGIVDRTSSALRASIKTDGALTLYNKVEISSAAGTANRKVVLFDFPNNDNEFFGFGVNPTILRYQIPGTGTSHRWYAGTSPTTSDELMILGGNGNLGLGPVFLPPTTARFFVQGGVQNIVGEDSAIRVSSALSNVKIELQNTAVGGKLYELRSASSGAFDIIDRTGSASRFVITSTGNIGINMGLSTPNAPLQFANTTGNRKIVLFETANNNHQFTGFGLDTLELRYQLASTISSHNFYAGTSSTTSVLLAQITGTGNIIIPGTYFGRRPSGTCYMQNNMTAVTTIAGVFQKVAGTTTATSTLNNFSMPASNRLQYTGTQQMMALILVDLTYIYNSSILHRIGFSIYKNGALVTPSAIYHDNDTTNFDTNVSLHTMVSLSTNDYVEVYCSSSAGGVSLTVTDLTFTVTAS